VEVKIFFQHKNFSFRTKNFGSQKIFTGYHTLALTHDQIILSWGDNRRGQLGTPHIQTSSSTPSQVNALSGEKVKQISAGNYHSACITGDVIMLHVMY
jgi:alpha-tubulin suppressor-like RCC1 family protein